MAGKQKEAEKKKYLVTNRLISWDVGGVEHNAEQGEVRDDIPPDALEYFLEERAVEELKDADTD